MVLNTSLSRDASTHMGFYRERAIGPPPPPPPPPRWKKIDPPPWKMLDPSGTLENHSYL